ncbi:cytochrome c551 [Ammoniphilus resinae]|uniref:Cytochrome c551 n=1 Tax=Ammoniphilus resinae TaxID=861532 RepID=A0ABS4GV78_9BACL|nr:cytochrome c [Ammoniphilus resinae]MBP1934164.1 cytochrome c551 [Ammoniphilus resinae]
MKKFSLAIVSLALVGALAACGGGGEQAQPAPAPAENNAGESASAGGDTAAAEGLYKNSCAGCHAADLSGAVGPNLQQVGARLSEQDILGVIENGRGGMPPGVLKGDDAKTVAAWLATHK